MRRGHGAQGRDRTTDTAIFSRMLYQLSYLGIAPNRAQTEPRGSARFIVRRGTPVQPPTDFRGIQKATPQAHKSLETNVSLKRFREAQESSEASSSSSVARAGMA